MPATPVPTTTVTFTEHVDDVLNPERGWWGFADIGGSFTGIRDPSHPEQTPPTTIALVEMHLNANLATIPQGTLDALAATAAAARHAGVKIVLRPLYRPDASGDDPTDVAFVVDHVHQFGPTVAANADVIAVVQLGMLGPVGEFFSSPLIANGQWVAILAALLEEVPTSRMVQVRRPCYKAHFLGGRDTALTEAEAFSGSDVARIGHYNDCLLANTLADADTYVNPPGVIPVHDVDFWRDYAATDTQWTFVGGETCGRGNNARASCESALHNPGDLVKFHWSFLGSGHFQGTVGPHGVLAAEGCRDEITKRLGYRLVLEQAVHSAAVRPGHSLVLSVRLRNDGFASPMNPRPVFVVLHAGATAYFAELGGADADPRRWAPGETRTLSRTLAVPASVAEGTYALSLWLPDAAPSIRADPKYAVRFVNDGTWEADTGRNVLTRTFTISAAATANTDPADATFAP